MPSWIWYGNVGVIIFFVLHFWCHALNHAFNRLSRKLQGTTRSGSDLYKLTLVCISQLFMPSGKNMVADVFLAMWHPTR
jgi:hypothetical protein